MKLEFEDGLCEEVVDQDLREGSLAGDLRLAALFREASDGIYLTVPLKRRDSAFQALFQKLFRSLGYRDRLEHILQEMRGFGPLPVRISFRRAFHAEEEGAQLSEDRAMLGIRIRAATLRDEGRCAYFLGHELTHIQDLLDPLFAADPTSALSDASPVEDHLLRDRYRTLWDLSVDGRLDRRKRLPEGVRERRAAEFQALFPSLGAEWAERAFEAIWSAPRPSDAGFRRMAEGAAALCAALGLPAHEVSESPGGVSYRPGAACPLCRFTTFEWAEPTPALAQAVQAEFPAWHPSRGICTQCGNRYLLGAAFAPRASTLRTQDWRA